MTYKIPSARPSIWPTSNLVIFDCDSTLSTVEGIDELARLADTRDETAIEIASLTKRAMEGEIPIEAIYRHRLGTVKPTITQVKKIAQLYRQHVISNASAVIKALQTLGCKVFIISGGLVEPVREFGVWLGVPRDHIFAVDMEYDQLSGKWWQYWLQSGDQNPQSNYLAVGQNPLTQTRGKNRIIAQLRSENPGRVLMVGDGLSDLETSPDVDLFIGFGGAVFRQKVADESPIYIQTPDMGPILPLALGQLGNTPQFAQLWAQGLQKIHNQEVIFNDPILGETFLNAMRSGLY